MKHLFTWLLLLTACAGGVRAQQSSGDMLPDIPPHASVGRQVCVLGNVLKPSAVAFEDSITLSRAIEEAGGALPDLKSTRALIIRRLPGGHIQPIWVKDLKGVVRRRSKDVPLRPGDVVDVIPKRKGQEVESPEASPCGDWYVFLKRQRMD